MPPALEVPPEHGGERRVPRVGGVGASDDELREVGSCVLRVGGEAARRCLGVERGITSVELLEHGPPLEHRGLHVLDGRADRLLVVQSQAVVRAAPPRHQTAAPGLAGRPLEPIDPRTEPRREASIELGGQVRTLVRHRGRREQVRVDPGPTPLDTGLGRLSHRGLDDLVEHALVELVRPRIDVAPSQVADVDGRVHRVNTTAIAAARTQEAARGPRPRRREWHPPRRPGKGTGR